MLMEKRAESSTTLLNVLTAFKIEKKPQISAATDSHKIYISVLRVVHIQTRERPRQPDPPHVLNEKNQLAQGMN